MALDLTVTYPEQVDDSDPNYPQGAPNNVVVEGDGTGFPLEKTWIRDLVGFEQALLLEAGITPSGVPDHANDSQYLTAVRIIGGQRLLEHKAMREWSHVVLPFHTSAKDCHYRFIAPARLSAEQSAIVALGHNVSDSNLFVYSRSFDGSLFDAEPVDADTTAGVRCAAGGADGEWLAGVEGSGDVVSHTQLGRVKAAETLPTDAPSALHYARFCTTYLAAGQTGGIYAGTTLALLAAATPYVIAGGEGFEPATLGVAGGEFADDDSANIVYAGSGTVSGTTRFRILHSADDGATWSVAHTCGPGMTSLNVAWSAVEELFVAIDSDGNILTSPTGATWTLLHATTTVNAAAGASERHGTFAIAANCIAKALNPTLYTDYSGSGVAYSFDLGATWRIHNFGYGFDFTGDYDVFENPQPILTLVAANDRFYASDDSRIYRSGLLAFEALTP